MQAPRTTADSDPSRTGSSARSELVATCALGTEDLVARELERLGLKKPARTAGAVTVEVTGDPLATAARLCVELRSAQRVLWPLARFEVTDADALYEGARAVAWEEWLTPRHTFAITATSRAEPPLANGLFLAQRIKDAVVDRMRERAGERPNVERDEPDVAIYAHVSQKRRKQGMGVPKVTLGLDVAGRGLHRRGYRLSQTEAPLRETLAAAILLATGWRGERPLVDPMCGSGTLAIEAAMIACGVAPGIAAGRARPAYGFERWPRFGDAERTMLADLLAAAEARVRPAEHAIVGRDHDPEVIDIARANLARCHPTVARAVQLEVGDVRQLGPLDPPGVILTNPPYGQRLGHAASPSRTESRGTGSGNPRGSADKGMQSFWRALGVHLRTLHGHTAFVLAAGPEMKRALGMRPTWERRLMNGPIAVELCRYELGRRTTVTAPRGNV